MKSLKIFATGALLAISLCASAQSATAKKGSVALPNEWQTGYFQWNPSSFVPSKGDDQSFTGLSLGWSKAFSISQTQPLFFEAGVGLQYSFYSDDDTESGYNQRGEKVKLTNTVKYNGFAMKIPVHLLYVWDIPNSKIQLMPFVGLNLRYNFSGKIKNEWDVSVDGYTFDEDELEGTQYEDQEFNVFDKDDMGGSKNTWKRFQIGWELGVKARFSQKYLLGLSYGCDFSEISKKTKIHTTSITLGYCF